jgi:hypothetical protein
MASTRSRIINQDSMISSSGFINERVLMLKRLVYLLRPHIINAEAGAKATPAGPTPANTKYQRLEDPFFPYTIHL